MEWKYVSWKIIWRCGCAIDMSIFSYALQTQHNKSYHNNLQIEFHT